MISGSTACLSGSKYTGLPWIILSLSRLPMSVNHGLAFCRRFPFTITIEEYLVFPYTSGNMELIDNFKRFVEYANIKIVDINREIAEQEAIIRGKISYCGNSRCRSHPGYHAADYINGWYIYYDWMASNLDFTYSKSRSAIGVNT